MREIKFRVWDKFEKEIWYPESFFRFCRGVPSNWQRCYELMQYTGLKDKRGKEIFEGDILRDNFNQMKLIQWFNDECRFAVKDIPPHPQADPYYILDQGYFEEPWNNEIIGNIYENKDLLEVTK